YKEEKKYENMVEKLGKNIKTEYYLPILSRLIVDFLAMNLINNTEKNFEILMDECDIKNNEDFYDKKLEIYNKEENIFRTVDYNENFGKQEKKFKEYLKNRILNSFKAQSMDGKANYIIKRLFKAYLSNPQQLPDKTIISFYRNQSSNYFHIYLLNYYYLRYTLFSYSHQDKIFHIFHILIYYGLRFPIEYNWLDLNHHNLRSFFLIELKSLNFANYV
ncbi:unnamed protein product, partial [marine sediment metagenome]